MRVKEAGLSAHLRYDDYERRSALVRFLPLDATARDWRGGGGRDLGDLVVGRYRVLRIEHDSVTVEATGSVTDANGRHAVRVEKRIAIGGSRLAPTLDVEVRVDNRSETALEVRVGLEWATTMLGGGGNPSAWWEVDGSRSRHDGEGAAEGVEGLAQGNDWLGTSIEASIEPAATAWWAPIETVSNSEDGFERVYQGSALLLSWPARIEPGVPWIASVRQAATVTRDRAGEELATASPGG